MECLENSPLLYLYYYEICKLGIALKQEISWPVSAKNVWYVFLPLSGGLVFYILSKKYSKIN